MSYMRRALSQGYNECAVVARFDYRLTACLGFRISFCTRQLFMSATKTTSSDGHASPCGQLNCLGPRPDSPSMPRILPSSVSLYIRPGSLSMANRYCVGPLVVMHSAHGAVPFGGFGFG